MINDHRPLWVKHLIRIFEQWHIHHFIAPRFESFGSNPMLMKPWNVKVHGRHINIGNNVHMVTDSHRKISFSTWTCGDHQGHIAMGDNVLVCPGCRFDSASNISIGDNCMFAAGAYITDADWHDVYDRTEVVGVTRPVILEENVWIGDGAKICKGVTIGKNSVIGAGSVVASDIPENVIAAGNPATVIKPLDPDRALVMRSQIFKEPGQLEKNTRAIEQYILKNNTFVGWIRSNLFPRRGD